MMRLDEAEPGLRVPNKSRLVLSCNMRRLEVNAVEAANDGIMQQSHMSCASGENVSLSHISAPSQLHQKGHIHTLFVAYCGVVTSFIGPSAHGLVGGDVSIINGEPLKKYEKTPNSTCRKMKVGTTIKYMVGERDRTTQLKRGRRRTKVQIRLRRNVVRWVRHSGTGLMSGCLIPGSFNLGTIDSSCGTELIKCSGPIGRQQHKVQRKVDAKLVSGVPSLPLRFDSGAGPPPCLGMKI